MLHVELRDLMSSHRLQQVVRKLAQHSQLSPTPQSSTWTQVKEETLVAQQPQPHHQHQPLPSQLTAAQTTPLAMMRMTIRYVTEVCHVDRGVLTCFMCSYPIKRWYDIERIGVCSYIFLYFHHLLAVSVHVIEFPVDCKCMAHRRLSKYCGRQSTKATKLSLYTWPLYSWREWNVHTLNC